MSEFEPIEYWKSIILLGLNNATYKIALGKSLIDLSANNSEIKWEDLSKKFLDLYIERISKTQLPQQKDPTRLTKLERIVIDFNNGLIDYGEAIDRVGKEGFNDVIHRFHTIGQTKLDTTHHFYQFDFGKKLYLEEKLSVISNDNCDDLQNELDARWSLLEASFCLQNVDYELINDKRDIYLKNGYARTNITSNIPFLQAYQGNVCFYCGESLNLDHIHVDHVLPRQVVCHDEIWNLVLSHSLCNLNKEDSLIGIHYLEKLHIRNENIVGSSHPWRAKIINALGVSKQTRQNKLLEHYNNVRIILNNRYWEAHPDYNRENDLFFKKLLTVINNK